MNYLELNNIHFKFKGEGIGFVGLSLQVSSGQVLGILGESGSGKTTLLKLLGGHLSPDHGQIWLNYENITNVPPQARPISTVFQDLALFPHLNVFDNVAFGLKLRKLPKSEIHRQTMQILDLMGLKPFLDKDVNDLSGGQRQRVALSRALAVSPKVLLLDEPFSSLDFNTMQRVKETIFTIKRNFNITIILVTHDHNDAIELCDKLCVIREFQLLASGPTNLLLSQPPSAEIVKYFGCYNEVSLNEEVFYCRYNRVRLHTVYSLPLVPAIIESISNSFNICYVKCRYGESILNVIQANDIELTPGAQVFVEFLEKIHI